MLPIFRLLQAFKLQQYAKALTELGYGFEIYKLGILGETSKFSVINKLNLMPGHRARFIDFFDIISKVTTQEDIKTKSNQRLQNDYVLGNFDILNIIQLTQVKVRKLISTHQSLIRESQK